MKKQAVYKYALQGNYINSVVMPVGAQILSVGHQPNLNQISIWALVDIEEKETEERGFLLAMTGQTMEVDKRTEAVFEHKFLNTIILNKGELVVHVFEIAKK